MKSSPMQPRPVNVSSKMFFLQSRTMQPMKCNLMQQNKQSQCNPKLEWMWYYMKWWELRSNACVALGTIISTNPKTIIGGVPLGKQYCEVVVNIVTKFLGRWGWGTGSRYVVRYLREIFTLRVENEPVNLGRGRRTWVEGRRWWTRFMWLWLWIMCWKRTQLCLVLILVWKRWVMLIGRRLHGHTTE
jgi:hypothetical protein